MNNKYSKVFVVGLLAILFVNTTLSYGVTKDNQNKIDLKIGSRKTVIVPGDKISQIDVSDTSILSAKISEKNHIALAGMKKGVANVTVMMQTGESLDYIVTTWNILPENIQDMTKDIPGLTLMPTGSRMVVMGGLLTQGDKERIQRIAEVFADDIDDLTYYDGRQSKNEALKHILKAIGNPNVQASFVDDNVVLKGTVYSLEDKERAEIAASAYVGEKGKVSNTIEVIDLSVEIDVTFVQLTPTSGSEIGADADKVGIFQGPSLTLNPKVNAGDAIGSSLQVGNIGYSGLETLTYLESKGLAKTIDKPHISTISGKPGRIQYGGQRGIKTTGEVGGDVTFVDFGLILEVTPVVRPDNMITIEMKLEVSQPTTSVSASGDFELQKFDTSTHGNIKVGETLVVSGLSQIIRERSKKNVPLIGNIPILNLLFANETDSDNQTNMVVLLTPHLPTIEKEAIAGPAGSRGAKQLYKKVTDPDMSIKDKEKK